MNIGWAAVDLDVPIGTPLGGYAARSGPSTGVLDGLQVAAVSVQAGADRWTWLVADLPCVNVDLADAVAAAVPGAVWLSATHTHAGPETGCAPGGAPTPQPWLDAVTAAAADAAARAATAAIPSGVELRRATVRRVGGQRSGARPRRTVPVDVLSVGEAGVIVVLPVHPTVLDAGNRCVSADLAGAVRRAVSARTGGWTVVATGAAGDVSTRPHRREQTPDECARLGELVADAVVRVLREPPLAATGATLRTGASTVALEPKPDAPLPTEALTAALAAARRSGDAVAIRTAWTALQAAELAGGEGRPTEPSCAVAVTRLGPLALVGLGAEPYLALGDGLRAALGPAAVLVGYTGGYVGYLPTRAAFRRPDYEVLRTPVAAGSAERALSHAISLIERIERDQ